MEFIIFVLTSEYWKALKLCVTFPANIYLFKVNNRNTRKRCEICSKLTMKISERRYRRHSGIFVVNLEQISHIDLMFVLLTVNK